MVNGENSQTSMNLRQDEDVLDTWFSSWLWPIEVFNGITQPNNDDINYYYPTSVLVTGQDIIFFWVARMIMAGEEYMKEKPFSDVYFTGMVRDKQGRKMSKSLGNSPDLLDLVDRFGADAVRFGILISAPAGNDLLFDESSLEQGKNFNNKIWNALKLVKMWESRIGNEEVEKNDFAIDWFENRLSQVKMQVEEMYKQFRLSEALKTIYSLIWDDFCSWYLEWVKPGFEQPIDSNVYNKTVEFFTELMQLLHPFMPFVTEEIYHQLKQREDDLCVRQNTKANDADNKILKLGELLKNDITALRDAKTKLQLKPRDPIDLFIETSKPGLYKEIESLLSKQVNAESVSYSSTTEPAAFTIIGNEAKIHISTNKQVDTSSQKEQLLKDLEYHKGFLLSVDKKLSNERFVQNAKADVVEIERKKKADAEQKIRSIEETLKGMS
jgi:valyl-tRNA synthetase